MTQKYILYFIFVYLRSSKQAIAFRLKHTRKTPFTPKTSRTSPKHNRKRLYKRSADQKNILIFITHNH